MSTTRPDLEPLRGAASARSVQRRLGLALVVICTAQLMLVLDETIVSTTPPYVQRALAFPGNIPEWAVNAYAPTFGGLLVTSLAAAASSSPGSRRQSRHDLVGGEPGLPMSARTQNGSRPL
jgi:hypothetical protein